MMDTLLDYTLAVYTHPEEQFNIFDRDTIDQKDKEYDQWCQSLHHTSALPLGLKQNDYILPGLTLPSNIDRVDDEEESELEEEELLQDPSNDFYSNNESDLMEEDSDPDINMTLPDHLLDMTSQ